MRLDISIGGIIGAALGFFLFRSIWMIFLGYWVGSGVQNFSKIAQQAQGQAGQGGARSSFRGSGGFYGRPSHDASYYRQRINQNDFAMALLVLSGAVMKADGKIVKSELEYVKHFLKQQFPPEFAQQQIRSFKDVLQKDFNIQSVCNDINGVMSMQQRGMLVQYLFGIANADGHIDAKEVDVISRISSYLGLSSADFEQLKGMFYRDTDSDYKSLGIEKSATNDEVKKAYRKMAVKHHPDKYSQMGDEHQKAAKEKFQKIQEAYEAIKKERGL